MLRCTNIQQSRHESQVRSHKHFTCPLLKKRYEFTNCLHIQIQTCSLHSLNVVENDILVSHTIRFVSLFNDNNQLYTIVFQPHSKQFNCL